MNRERHIFAFEHVFLHRKLNEGRKNMRKSFVAFAALVFAFTLVSAGMAATMAETATFVGMFGKIGHYGPVPAFGFLKAFAKVDEWARVNAAWMTAPMPIVKGSPGSPVIFSFFAAHLINASLVKLDYTDPLNRTHDFFVAGLWGVLNVTFVFQDSTFFWMSRPMVDRGPGVLAVDADPVNGTPWSVFTLAIDGFLPVRGRVMFHRVKTVEIPDGDVVMDSKIDIKDLAVIAKSYGSMPGRAGYDFTVDINFDWRVDIKDLAAVAKVYGVNY